MNKISDFELEKNIIARDRSKYPKDLEISLKEFNQLMYANPTDFLGCVHKDRIEFLEKNGYEITHENLINPDLSVRISS